MRAELAVFLAPNVNSYKRYAAGSWAPTTLAWGHDNRTCGFRIVGHGRASRPRRGSPAPTSIRISPSRRSSRPASHGIEKELELPPPLEGNAYESDAARFPHSLREAIEALETGTMARAAFGDEVVDHYLNYARTEQRLFDEVGHLLRAGADVRARMKPVDRDHDLRRGGAWGAWDEAAALVPLTYVRAVERAGGRPLLVPPSEDAVEETLDVLDGIVFSGGSDLDPALYGADAHPETNGDARRSATAPSSRS